MITTGNGSADREHLCDRDDSNVFKVNLEMKVFFFNVENALCIYDNYCIIHKVIKQTTINW